MVETTEDDTVDLREAMVAELRSMGAGHDAAVSAALTRVPRHLFAPDTPLEKAYAANSAIWPKHDERGVLTSTMSSAHLQATMLEQAQLRPGMRVLEIGSGGYNAALLQEIVGDTGEVTTLDIDADIIDRARTCLDRAGYQRVRAVVADGENGAAEYAPYDRIIVTVRAWDIPPAWLDDLGRDGRLVVPLELRALTRSVALDRTHTMGTALLRSGDVRLCSFVPMQGLGAHADTVVAIEAPEGPRLRLRSEVTGDTNLEVLRTAVAQAASSPAHTVWTGVEFDHVDDLDLWLALHLPRFGILHADYEPPGGEGVSSLARAGAPALLSPGGYAHRVKRPIPGTDRFETGVLARGPQAEALVAVYAEAVRAWGRYRAAGGSGPQIEVHPAASNPTVGDGEVLVAKHHVALVVGWPTP